MQGNSQSSATAGRNFCPTTRSSPNENLPRGGLGQGEIWTEKFHRQKQTGSILRWTLYNHRCLGQGAYRLQLPAGFAYHNRFNAARLAHWVDSDLTLFLEQHCLLNLDLVPPHPNAVQMPLIKRYLLRDYSQFPTAAARYWVLSDSEQCPYFWVDETSDILDEFLQLEETNGSIPQQGSTSSNIDAVRRHKQQVYLQHTTPILVNTWQSSKLPFQVRKRPTFRRPTSLINALVQDHFHVSDIETSY